MCNIIVIIIKVKYVIIKYPLELIANDPIIVALVLKSSNVLTGITRLIFIQTNCTVRQLM